MNDVDGMEILGRARKTLPDGEVIMVTGHATVPKAVEAMQQGAFNFLEKPITPNRLRAVTEKAADAVRLKKTNEELARRLDEKFGYEGIIFSSAKMQAVIDRTKRIAPTDATVLITGENGTGKELIAQAIHQNSPRKAKPLVALNAGAVAENLVESELFGHVRGAFTDALSDRVGKFEYANGGTLFLDEIGDIPMSTQIKLLRVLEDRQITRVGDNKSIKVNVHQPKSGAGDQEWHLPARSVLSVEGRHDRATPAGGAPRGHRPVGGSLSPAVRAGAWQAGEGDLVPSFAAVFYVSVAR
jgi:two-component system response regulator HydG